MTFDNFTPEVNEVISAWVRAMDAHLSYFGKNAPARTLDAEFIMHLVPASSHIVQTTTMHIGAVRRGHRQVTITVNGQHVSIKIRANIYHNDWYLYERLKGAAGL